MIKDKSTTIAFIVASITLHALIALFVKDLNIGEFIGGAFALMFWSYLLTLLIRWLNKLFGAQFTDNSFFKTFMVVWILIALSQYISSTNH